MACTTLKRRLDMDPLHSPTRSNKRRRYINENIPTPTCSAFSDATPKVDREFISTSIREEIRRLNRRKQLFYPPNQQEAGLPGSANGLMDMCSISGSPPLSEYESALGTSKDRDKPLFTFRQVGLICERMIREREENLKQAYEKVLATKLAEQYDQFVKFTYDQIQKRFETENAPSYLS